jgi:hypothetical protein
LAFDITVSQSGTGYLPCLRKSELERRWGGAKAARYRSNFAGSLR